MPIWHATPRVGLSFRFGSCFLSVIAAVASQTARPYAKA